MDESILISIKELLGVGLEEDYFDPQIIMHINTYIAVLAHIGLTTSSIFEVKNTSQTWGQLLGQRINNLNMVKSYIFIKVKLLFDPPSSSFVLESYKNQAVELEWRINELAEEEII